MAYRKVIFANNEIYHVLNRGVEERTIFEDKRDYRRFIDSFVYYQKTDPPTRFSFQKRIKKEKSEKDNLVEIFSYCLMPNHFHFLLKQIKEAGISLFISRLTNSYTRYFNTRHQRSGHLFQGPFRAVRVASEEQFLHVSRYIHLNPLVSFLVKDLKDYPYSSYLEYLDLNQNSLVCVSEMILSQFSSPAEYEKFVLDQKDYAINLKKIEKSVL